MPDDAVATISQLEIPHSGEERLGLHLDSLRKQLSGAGAKDNGQLQSLRSESYELFNRKFELTPFCIQ